MFKLSIIDTHLLSKRNETRVGVKRELIFGDDPCFDNIFGLLKLEIRPEYNTVADLTELRLNQSE